MLVVCTHQRLLGWEFGYLIEVIEGAIALAAGNFAPAVVAVVGDLVGNIRMHMAVGLEVVAMGFALL